MTYSRRVFYQMIITSIFIGLLWCAELEKGCKRSVARSTSSFASTAPEVFSQIECTHLPKMNLPPDVKSLTVQGDLRVLTKEALGTSFMLHKLNVSNCNITFIQDKAFTKIKQLMILILTNNHIEYIEEGTFSNLRLLTELHIDGNNLKVIIPGSLKNIAYLQVLNLQNNRLLEIPEELPKNLVILNMANNDIEHIDIETLNNMEHLEILNLVNNSIKNWPKGNPSFPSLKYLSLGSSITSAHFGGFLYPNLKYLHLSAKSIDRANFEGITFIEVDSLDQLVLEKYNIENLSFLNQLKNLKMLHFTRIIYNGKNITLPSDLINLNLERSPEIGNLLLNSRQMFYQLRTVSLRNCNITSIDNNQAEQLMKTVRSLDISQNPIRCTMSEWNWVIKKVKTNPSFIVNKDNVICNTPSQLNGKNLLAILESFYSKKEQRKITYMSIMEQYIATYETEKINIPEELEIINDQEHKSKNNIVYGILIALTLMGTLFLFIHLCHKKRNCSPGHDNMTIEYSRNNERINFRKDSNCDQLNN